MKNAKEVAKALTNSINTKVDGLKTASQDLFKITAKNNLDVNDYHSDDTNEIEKKVTVIVRASFLVK